MYGWGYHMLGKSVVKTADELKDRIIELNQQKEMLLKKIQKFKIRYEKELGVVLKEILYLRREISKDEYLKYKQQETKDECIDAEYVVVLDDEDKAELKRLYKKATKLCHPDIVAYDKKDDAQEIFKELNDAYMKQDISMVRELLLYLEGGDIFSLQESDVEFEGIVKVLEDEINYIKNKHEFSFVFEILDMDEYFEQKKQLLRIKLDKLKNGGVSVLDYEEWVKNIFRWADRYKIRQDIIPRDEKKLKALEILNLSGLTLLHILSDISNLTSLKELDISNNKLAKVSEKFSNLTNLRVLNLSRNDLERIPDEFLAMKNLEYINLSSNRFKKIPACLFDMKNLLHLDISKSFLESAHSSIYDLSKLRYLNLGGNFLHSISSDIFKLEKLQHLIFWGNKLQSIPESISDLKNLKELNLGSNNLKYLPKDIVKLTDLEVLELFMNPNLKLTKQQEKWRFDIESDIL